MGRAPQLVLLLASPAALFASVPGRATPLFAPYEVALAAAGVYANPYAECAADVVLDGPRGDGVRTAPLFWDGGSTWRFRFAPDRIGAWKWQVRSTDAGLNGQAGSFTVVPSEAKGGIRPMAAAPLGPAGADRFTFAPPDERDWLVLIE